MAKLHCLAHGARVFVLPATAAEMRESGEMSRVVHRSRFISSQHGSQCNPEWGNENTKVLAIGRTKIAPLRVLLGVDEFTTVKDVVKADNLAKKLAELGASNANVTVRSSRRQRKPHWKAS